MRLKHTILIAVALLATAPPVVTRGAENAGEMTPLIDRAIGLEKELIAELTDLHPLADIYIQRLRVDAGGDEIYTDEYHVGRAGFGPDGPDYKELRPPSVMRLGAHAGRKIKSPFIERGLIQMELADNAGLAARG